MNLNITISENVSQHVKDNVVNWLNEVAAWSQARYPAIDLAAGTTINIETHEFSAVAMKPQTRPVEIRMSELDVVTWPEAIQKREWFKSQMFYVGLQVGTQANAAAVFRSTQHTLARDIPDDSFREGFDSEVQPPETKLEWLKEFHPDLVKSWVDRSNWLTDHVSRVPHTHWSFPSTPKGLCRLSGASGPGSVWPPGCER